MRTKNHTIARYIIAIFAVIYLLTLGAAVEVLLARTANNTQADPLYRVREFASQKLAPKPAPRPPALTPLAHNRGRLPPGAEMVATQFANNE